MMNPYQLLSQTRCQPPGGTFTDAQTAPHARSPRIRHGINVIPRQAICLFGVLETEGEGTGDVGRMRNLGF